jgi:hypothetical protein
MPNPPKDEEELTGEALTSRLSEAFDRIVKRFSETMIGGPAPTVIFEAVNEINEEARQRHPVDTGALRNSIPRPTRYEGERPTRIIVDDPDHVVNVGDIVGVNGRPASPTNAPIGVALSSARPGETVDVQISGVGVSRIAVSQDRLPPATPEIHAEAERRMSRRAQRRHRQRVREQTQSAREAAGPFEPTSQRDGRPIFADGTTFCVRCNACVRVDGVIWSGNGMMGSTLTSEESMRMTDEQMASLRPGMCKRCAGCLPPLPRPPRVHVNIPPRAMRPRIPPTPAPRDMTVVTLTPPAAGWQRDVVTLTQRQLEDLYGPPATHKATTPGPAIRPARTTKRMITLDDDEQS